MNSKELSGKPQKLSVWDICLTGVFTALTIVCAQISIPMPLGVPMTLQTLVIPLAGIVLGPWKGTLSVLAYIALGAVGLPVFSGFKGGPGVLFGLSGGFILSFPLIALTAGLGEKRNHLAWYVCGLTAGTVINYACGMFFYSFAASASLRAAFTACVLPFIPTALIKLVLAGISGRKLKKVIGKRLPYH